MRTSDGRSTVVTALAKKTKSASMSVAAGNDNDVIDEFDCSTKKPTSRRFGTDSVDGPGTGLLSLWLAWLSVKLLAVVSAGSDTVAMGVTCSNAKLPTVVSA